MSIPYTSGDFTSARANGESWVEYPFIEEGDNTTKVYHLVCEVNEADYAPIALDTTMANATNADVIELPFAADAAAYFVGDYDKTKIDGGLTRFDRQFANIPATRNSVFSGTTAYSFPGTPPDKTGGTVRTATNASTTLGITTITCTNTVSVGDVVYINIVSSTGGITYTDSGYYIALTGTTSSVVKISFILPGLTFNSGTVTQLIKQPRAQKTIPTGSLSDFTYYLPGVSIGITTPTDVTETDVFAPYIAGTGEAASILSDNTIPSPTAYNAEVTAGNYLTIESNVTKWRGNIIQKQNVKVRAL